jgi:hypothetical protein
VNPSLRSRIVVSVAIALLGVAGCGGPSSMDVLTGAWRGVASLPNGVTTNVTLQQNGDQVSGTMSITGALNNQPLSGVYSSSTRKLTWSVPFNCEMWTGELTLDATGRKLEGSIGRNGSGCVPPVSNANGTLTLDKQ